MKRIVVIVAIVLSAGLIAGCGDEATVPPGNLTVSWLVGTGGCDSVDVNTIAIFVSGGGEPNTDLYTFSCLAGSATIPGLRPGTYDLSLRGRDATGVDRFGGLANNVQIRSSGTTTVPTVRLSALPARITVSWYFENGRFCSFNNVETVDIALFEDEYEIYTADAECALGILELEDIQADTYIIDLVGRGPDGQALYNGQEEVSVDRGDTTTVEVRLAAIPRN